jgi:UDP-GlcNAc:undecaprenyl-phosphate GlcNAc-1-phosphate transferase
VKSFFLLVISAAVSMMVIPLAWRLAPHIGMIDQPDPRKVHSAPVPRIGGWGIAAGCLVPLLFLRNFDPLLLSFIAGTLVLFVFGTWDDARQLGHWPKFVGQLVAVGIVVFWGDLYVTRIPFVDGTVLSPLIGQLLTVVAMVGVINAINHSDGLDGLAAGETMLSLIALAFLGYQSGSALGMEVALAMIGGIIGFLRYNTHPARVFMGDSGSQILGFAVAFLVIHLVQVANTAVSAALPLLLLGLPIADINAVLYQRIRGGMSWFKATRNHVHHRLLDLGFSHYQSVVVIYSFQAVLVTSGVLLRYASDWTITLLYFGAIAALFIVLVRAERAVWQWIPKTWPQLESLSTWIAGLRANNRVQDVVVWVIAGTGAVLMLVAATLSATVPKDFGVTAALAALLTATS